VRFSTLHRRDVERTELPSTRQCKDHGDFLLRQTHVSVKRALWRLAEALTALLAFESLDSLFPVVARFDHFGTAVVACHFAP
jgi:hypothetical protein